MKIMFFTMSMGHGGAERVIANLANNYASGNDSVTVVTCQNLQCEYSLKNKVQFLKLDQKDANNNKILRFIRRRNVLKKILNNQHYDIIICFLPEPSFIMLSLKQKYKLKVIVSERWDPVQEYSKLFHKVLMNILYPLADGFVFQTKDAQDYFDNKIKNNSIIIPNPISEEFLHETYLPERKKEIVSVGRLFPQKNHKLLIDAFKIVHEKFPDFTLKIYGKGILKEALQLQIRELHLEKSVYLMGEVLNIKQVIKDASLFVLSSNSEGMPNALMEAMALGLPVISTDCPCGGPKYLIQDGVNGLLVKVGDKQDMADKIMLLLENSAQSETMAQNAMHIVEQINPDHIYNEWKNYIQKIYLQA